MLRSPRALALALLAPAALACGAVLTPAAATAQTMATVAAGHSSCTTLGGEGLSAQLVAVQTCLRPGQFVSFANANITATSSRVHLVAQASARDALQTAAATVPLQINSAFRPLSDQYLLWASGQCSVVATPGGSNHQSGRAVDVNNTVEARTALTDAGCVWFGSTDAVHYDCPGSDLRADAVFSFQRLWNINHPEAPLSEDGVWGPMTRGAMDESPAAGFTYGGADACGPCPMGAELNACGTCGAAPTEVCNGADDDCDGTTDEGCPGVDAGVPLADAGPSLSDAGMTNPDASTSDVDAATPPAGGGPSSGCHVARATTPASPATALALVAVALLGLARRRDRSTLPT